MKNQNGSEDNTYKYYVCYFWQKRISKCEWNILLDSLNTLFCFDIYSISVGLISHKLKKNIVKMQNELGEAGLEWITHIFSHSM